MFLFVCVVVDQCGSCLLVFVCVFVCVCEIKNMCVCLLMRVVVCV